MTDTDTDAMTGYGIDPIHPGMTDFGMPIIDNVWANKYKWHTDDNFYDMCHRVCNGIYAKDPDSNARSRMLRFMQLGLWMPGGRILAGAGTSKVVTLMNCYVNTTLADSMLGIMKGLQNVAFTLQQGGGIGTDFSTLRPMGASLKRTGPGSAASGPIPFMRTWNALSNTIKSAGDRRGAMMATLSDSHPDLPAFIKAKQVMGELLQFNISVLVSDAFMEAVSSDASWLLYFSHQPAGARTPELAELDFVDEDGILQYAYSIWKACELWSMIMESTYDYAEPGVIFIDRVNDLNNLNYCEVIRCTNPCGEQPLPPHGACDLGAVNLARMVKHPFTDAAEVDFDLLEAVVIEGVRFLDNVIDVTDYPLDEQRTEQYNKRRVGLGISGLADLLAQLKVRYGSSDSIVVTEEIMRTIANAAYMASAMLAQERGAFPLYDSIAIPKSAFFQKLNPSTKATIQDLGLRNGVLLTIAPTGTISLVYGNLSSGLEPTFAHVTRRKVFSSNAAHEAEVFEENMSYSWRLFKAYHTGKVKGLVEPNQSWIPPYMDTAQTLSVEDHLAILAVCQTWVDASISKTINLPKDITRADFEAVYMRAYELGCKGCTTYRPSEIRGSVLEDASKPAEAPTSGLGASAPTPTLRVRPECLDGSTYKIKWPTWNSAVYVTINHTDDGQPYEIFITSKDARHQEWMTALTLMISAIMRRGGQVGFIADELKSIKSVSDGAFVNGKYYGSLPARIGEVIEGHFNRLAFPEFLIDPAKMAALPDASELVPPRGEVCPSCGAPTLIHEEGCSKCTSCGHSKCG